MKTATWHELKALEKDELRVPTIFELIELQRREYGAERYWSSSSLAYYSGHAWVVYFGNGNVDAYIKYYALNVRLVRAGQSFDHWMPVSEEEVAAFRKDGTLPAWHPPLDKSMEIVGAHTRYRGVDIMHCPNCKNDLDGRSIYETFFEKYGDEEKALEIAAMYGATKTEGRWGRQIAIYDIHRDRTVAYRCPDCGHRWDR